MLILKALSLVPCMATASCCGFSRSRARGSNPKAFYTAIYRLSAAGPRRAACGEEQSE